MFISRCCTLPSRNDREKIAYKDIASINFPVKYERLMYQANGCVRKWQISGSFRDITFPEDPEAEVQVDLRDATLILVLHEIRLVNGVEVATEMKQGEEWKLFARTDSVFEYRPVEETIFGARIMDGPPLTSFRTNGIKETEDGSLIVLNTDLQASFYEAFISGGPPQNPAPEFPEGVGIEVTISLFGQNIPVNCHESLGFVAKKPYSKNVVFEAVEYWSYGGQINTRTGASL